SDKSDPGTPQGCGPSSRAGPGVQQPGFLGECPVRVSQGTRASGSVGPRLSGCLDSSVRVGKNPKPAGCALLGGGGGKSDVGGSRCGHRSHGKAAAEGSRRCGLPRGAGTEPFLARQVPLLLQTPAPPGRGVLPASLRYPESPGPQAPRGQPVPGWARPKPWFSRSRLQPHR